MQTYMKLRQQGNSVGFTVPSKLARAWDLRIGDAVLWEIADDIVTLKFSRLSRQEPTGANAPVGQEVSVDG